MITIQYDITLLQHTLVTSLDGDPNSAVAYDFIPGSVLRGTIIREYMRANKLFDPTNPQVRRLFFDGSTRFLNGYPVFNRGRALPTPKSFRQEKKDKTRFTDFTRDQLDDMADTQWKRINTPFCRVNEGQVSLVPTPGRDIQVHILRDRQAGHSISDSGAVYRYDSLAEGQVFRAVILCATAKDADLLRSYIPANAWLGGSQNAGYGHVKIEFVQEISSNWTETGQPLPTSLTSRIVVTLLSDVFVRDNFGQFCANAKALQQAVETRLGARLKVESTFQQERLIGGFNRKWGLPLPQAQVIEMGSVYVFTASQQVAPTGIQSLLDWGIGERRAEGFGRVALDWTATTLVTQNADDDESEAVATMPTIVLSGTDRALAIRMAKRLLQRDLDVTMLTQVQQLTLRNVDGINKSQLSRLRTLIKNVLQEGTTEMSQISALLDDVPRRKTTREQFERVRIGSTKLHEWLIGLLQWNNSWATYYSTVTVNAFGGVIDTEILSDALKQEYILRLMDAALARIAKEKQSKTSTGRSDVQ